MGNEKNGFEVGRAGKVDGNQSLSPVVCASLGTEDCSVRDERAPFQVVFVTIIKSTRSISENTSL